MSGYIANLRTRKSSAWTPGDVHDPCDSHVPLPTARKLRRGAALLLIAAATCTACASSLRADDAYYTFAKEKLELIDAEWPETERDVQRHSNLRRLVPYAVLDGEGEIYLGTELGEFEEVGSERFILREAVSVDTNGDEHIRPADLAVRAPADQAVTGTLFVPNDDATALVALKFRVSDAKSEDLDRQRFYRTKQQYYDFLRARRLPGAAWFRHQAREARRQATGKTPDAEVAADGPDRDDRTGLEETYDLFTGGRAVSENLQLDRVLPTTAPAEPTVEISSLEGITTQEMDWTELVKDIDPQLDPLARYVPHDQPVAFFRNFSALGHTIDEALAYGTPLLNLISAEDAGSIDKYQRQLCLSIDSMGRRLGRQLTESVAVTASDPYVRTGTDVAVILECRAPRIVAKLFKNKQKAAARSHDDAQLVEGTIGELHYNGVTTPDREVSSYVATLDGAVVITNSLAQLENIAATMAETTPSITSLSEYRFFRHRYDRANSRETGMVVLTDAAIRRLCSPKWRIAASRRTRAAAVMAEQQAEHLSDLVAGRVDPQQLHPGLHVHDMGTLTLTPQGVASSTYGTLEFLTPIHELEIAKVTEAEAEAYNRWRVQYQRYWSQVFDPIAVSFSLEDEQVSADVTVMPLIQSSDYADYIDIVSGAALDPDDGDPHEDTLVHFVMAIDLESAMVRRASNFAQVMTRTVNGSAFGWLGNSIAIYAEPDPVWKQLADADEPDQYFLREMDRFPVAIRAEVKDSLKLTVFLAGLRGFIEQTAPGMLTWETLEHNEQPYVRVTPNENARTAAPDVSDDAAVYYAATPRALVVTLNEQVLKQSIDREVKRVAANKEAANNESDASSEPDESQQSADQDDAPKIADRADNKVEPWLGSSMALQVDGPVFASLNDLLGDEHRAEMQAAAWRNIPVLNEWHSRFPDADPVELHRRYWQVTLRCPGGGKYVWNNKFQTMESTVYGHPAEPKPGPGLPPLFTDIEFANFGVTFEHDGLRARFQLDRKP